MSGVGEGAHPAIPSAFALKSLSLLIPVILVLSACSLFNLREPEEPEEREGWEYPDEPHIVLDNLRNSYMTYNIGNYLECFDSTRFVFNADEDLLNGPRGYLYENWDFEKEKERTSALFNSLDLGSLYPILLNLSIDNADTFVDSVSFYVDYGLTVNISGGRTVEARGKSLFYIKKDPTGLWHIIRWDDFKTDTSALSWAEVKAGDY